MAPKSVAQGLVSSAPTRCRNMSYDSPSSSSSRLGCLFNYTQIKPAAVGRGGEHGLRGRSHSGDSNNNNSKGDQAKYAGKAAGGGGNQRGGVSSLDLAGGRRRTAPSLQLWIDDNAGLVNSLLFLLAISVYWNSLDGDLVFDDITAVRDNKDLRPHTPLGNLWKNDFWGTPMHKEQSHKSYRPLTVLTFRLNYWLSGLSPQPFHLVNVILHGLVCLLYLRFCRRLVSSSVVALIAAVLFALHPVRRQSSRLRQFPPVQGTPGMGVN